MEKKGTRQSETAGNTKENVFITSDYPTICFLIAHDIPFNGVNRIPGQNDRLEFTFGEAVMCEELVRYFENGDDDISARKLLDATKRVKKIIHSTL